MGVREGWFGKLGRRRCRISTQVRQQAKVVGGAASRLLHTSNAAWVAQDRLPADLGTLLQLQPCHSSSARPRSRRCAVLPVQLEVQTLLIIMLVLHYYGSY